MLAAGTPEEGRSVVRAQKAQRADFVKVRSSLDRATYFAILAEARRIGIPADGHVSFSLGAGEASDSGQRTIEHLAEGVLAGCTASDSSSRAEILAAQEAPMSPRRRAAVIAIFRRMAEQIDERSCLALGQRLARNGTAFTPTLVTERIVMDRFDAPPLAADERLHLPRAMQQWYDQSLGSLQRDTGEVWRQHFRRQLAIVPMLQRAGTTILAGTDLGTQGYPTPGYSLHQELGLLVQAGLTPLQALQAATINPARALGATDTLGTVSAGRVADLVVLDADPIVDIANARRIHAVIANGRLLDRAALDGMLSEAARRLAAEPLPPTTR
jgi:imidazolonepropionase-like amidohydrolase